MRTPTEKLLFAEKVIGQKTQWGKIVAVVFPEHPQAGELMYFMQDKRGGIALIPAASVDTVEEKQEVTCNVHS